LVERLRVVARPVRRARRGESEEKAVRALDCKASRLRAIVIPQRSTQPAGGRHRAREKNRCHRMDHTGASSKLAARRSTTRTPRSAATRRGSSTASADKTIFNQRFECDSRAPCEKDDLYQVVLSYSLRMPRTEGSRRRLLSYGSSRQP
jgi:hypothetical protein